MNFHHNRTDQITDPGRYPADESKPLGQPSVVTKASRPGRFSIAKKVFFWLIVQTLVVVAACFLMVNWAFDRGFSEYMSNFNDQRAAEMAERLADEYTRTGSWAEMQNSPLHWAELAMATTSGKLGTANDADGKALSALFVQFQKAGFPADFPVPLPLRFVLMDANGTVLIGTLRDTKIRKQPIISQGQRVGFIAYSTDPVSKYDLRFRERFSTALKVIILGSVLLALLPALLIARLVTRPVKALSKAARALAEGRTKVLLKVESEDELGELCRDFNGLLEALEKHDKLQRSWLAEIAHELRTPVSILTAEIEAILDQVRPLDKKAIRSLHEEVQGLTRLIGDLNQLSRADFGDLHFQYTTDTLSRIISQSIAGKRDAFNERQIRVKFDTRAANFQMRIDADKMRQVFLNLLENSLRYTDEGGQVRITVQTQDQFARIIIEDSSPGVSPDEMALLFQRLYRGESSRNRASGGFGLGLAIVRSIVEAHRGSIEASASSLGGVRFEILMPMSAQ